MYKNVEGLLLKLYTLNMERLSVSLCIITLNEELNIRRCIGSVPFVDDIVVLDSGSIDQTRLIAEEMGARVFNEEWRGYGRQKQRAVELAKNDWVICLDADEELTPELQSEIYGTLKENRLSFKGYRSPRRTFHLGQWIFHGGWYPNYQTRFFNRTRLQWSPDDLHEAVRGDGIGDLQSAINHYPFKNLADQAATNNQYSSVAAEILRRRGRSFYWNDLLIKPFVKFIELYLIKRGFLDGVRGLILAGMGAYAQFMRFAKLWEIEQQKPKDLAAPSHQKIGSPS